MSDRHEKIELVIAIVSVAGATSACAAHGDEPTVEMLARHYALVADEVRRAEGRVIKVVGDGVIVTFPVARAASAMDALRSLQESGSRLWRQFDERCRVQVKAGVGAVIRGPFGPPGQEREDIYGDALSQLFKTPAGDFELSAALKLRIDGNRDAM